MKQQLILLTMALMIFLLAGGSYAQDPVQYIQYDGNGGIARNDYYDADETGPHGDLIGLDDADKLAEDDDPTQYIQYDGNGGIVRNDYFDEDETGPHGCLFGLDEVIGLLVLPLNF